MESEETRSFSQADGLFGYAKNNGADLSVDHDGIGLPETAGHATAGRFEFSVDALSAGLQGGEEVKLGRETSTQTLLQTHLPTG